MNKRTYNGFDPKFISPAAQEMRKIEYILKEAKSASIIRDVASFETIKDILEKAKNDDLSFKEINFLINAIYSPRFPQIKEYLLDVSSLIREKVFSNKVIPMAPVEASNICASNCLFCGWRSSNRQMERARISKYLIMEQVKYLISKGIYYIEFVGGDDFDFVRNTLPSLVQSTRKLSKEIEVPIKICFCSMALTENQYGDLKELGADSMIVWQETYDRQCYQQYIIGGPKANGISDGWKIVEGGDGFLFRLHSQERALKAGLEVALGSMLGLNGNQNYEILATIGHGRYLIEKYGTEMEAPLIIGMPTWNQITTPSTDNRPENKQRIDDHFSYFAAIYFLSLPKEKAWIFPNCRVGLEEQIEAVKAAGVFTSTEVKLGPGGYLPSLLAEKRENGEDTKELEDRIAFEFGTELSDLTSLGETLDSKEQFLHHYYPHEVYLRKMEDAGLNLLKSTTLGSNLREA